METLKVKTGLGHQLRLKQRSIDSVKSHIDAAWKEVRDMDVDLADEEIINIMVDINELSKRCERLSHSIEEAYKQNG